MKKFKICVETGPTGNDFYEMVIQATSLERAIKLAYAEHKKNRSGTAMIIENACCEVIDLIDDADAPAPAPVPVYKMKKGEMLAAMLVISTNGHAGQFDKGGNPYILHPLKVMHYLKTDDEELHCVALGHDVIEDTKVTYKDLRDAGISERVIAAIRCLTKQQGQTLEEYKEAVFSNVDAMRVKLADLRHNTDIRRLKGVTPKDLERMAKYHLFYTEIQAKLAEIA